MPAMKRKISAICKEVAPNHFAISPVSRDCFDGTASLDITGVSTFLEGRAAFKVLGWNDRTDTEEIGNALVDRYGCETKAVATGRIIATAATLASILCP